MIRPRQPKSPLPTEFADKESLLAWGRASSFGGGLNVELVFGDHQLVVVFRCHKSGMPDSEPIIFAEIEGKWERLLCAAVSNWGATASVEGDYLVIWRTSRGDRRDEWFRLNLAAVLA